MESLDVLVSEEAQQDMDLKSAFVPAVPRQSFFRILLGDLRQSPGKTRGINWSSIQVSGRYFPKSKFAETNMKTTPKPFGSLPMNQAFSLLKPFLPLPDFGAYKLRLATTL